MQQSSSENSNPKQVTSYGIIPLQKREGIWWVYLIQHHAGHWGFPKGHPNKNETPLETAERELKEETNLSVKKFMTVAPIEESYHYDDVTKTVVYYLATVEGEVKIQEEEIQNGVWIMLDDASDQVTFPESKSICSKVILSLR